jgi:hypothetical protein
MLLNQPTLWRKAFHENLLAAYPIKNVSAFYATRICINNCGLDRANSRQVPKQNCCEHGNQPLGSVEDGQFLDQLSNNQRLKNDSAPWKFLNRRLGHWRPLPTHDNSTLIQTEMDAGGERNSVPWSQCSEVQGLRGTSADFMNWFLNPPISFLLSVV